jgi:hypothetical protein
VIDDQCQDSAGAGGNPVMGEQGKGQAVGAAGHAYSEQGGVTEWA